MNVRHLLPRTHEGYAACFAVAAAAIIVASLASMADAGGFRQVSCGQRVVHHQAAVVAAIPYPVAGFQVGQYLQQQAVEEYAFRRSPSKERLTFLEGYYAAKQEEIPPAAPPQLEDSSTSEPQAFSAPQSKAGKYIESIDGFPPPPALEQAAAPPADFATAHPTIAAKCATCHADAEAKGGFGIADEVAAAKANSDCENILGIIDSMAFERMPKGAPLTDAEFRAAVKELISK